MREFNALNGYPQPKNPRMVSSRLRTINNRIIASYRDKEYYEGDRNNGYGGFKYDGRWFPIAEDMSKEYNLNDNSAILQIGCEKGFLLHEFKQLFPNIKIRGTEISNYAIANSMPTVKPFIINAQFTNLPFKDGEFDFVIAIGVVYTLNLADAIKCLTEIKRVSKGKSFITIAAYRTGVEMKLFKYWTLLGSTILHEEEWIEVLKHTDYMGDYHFTTARSLNLIEEK